MNRINEDELDAFLWEVEHVSKQVKDIIEGKVDVDKVQEKERIIKEKREKEEAAKKFKEEQMKKEMEEKLQKGVSGKGEKDNYKKLCKRCFVEYQIDHIDKCYHCGKGLMTKQERHAELKAKVEELKEFKARKKYKKQKYENWMKTEGILKTKKLNFQNYQKWDLYESSTDEEEKGEPILPRHDPNFIALEKDMIESQKKREASRNKAMKLKDEGNKMLNEGKFNKAIKLYTEAIAEFGGMMTLYTNRALAFIKVEDYDSAIKDCEKVIEYLEIFEEELNSNKDLYVKALSRKALCCQKMKNYDEAKEMIEKGLEIRKGDLELEKLHSNILLEEEVHKKALNVINGDLTQFQSIDKFVESLRNSSNHQEFENMYIQQSGNFEKVKLLLKVEENNKLYFIQKAGLEILFSHVKRYPLILDILELFNEEKKFILLINNIKGYNKLIGLLFEEKNSNDTKDSSNIENNLKGENGVSIGDSLNIKKIVSILEDASQHEEVRKAVTEMKHISDLFIISLSKFDISSDKIINDGNSVIILLRLFTFVCNIAYSSPTVRTKIASQFNLIMEKVNNFSKIFTFNNKLHTNLLESILSFLINLSCQESFRGNLMKEDNFIKFVINENLKKIAAVKANFSKYDELYEKCLSLLYNLSYRDDLNQFYLDQGVSEVIRIFILNIFEETFKNCSSISLIRSLMLSVKLVKTDYTKFLIITNDEYNFDFFTKIANITNLKMLKESSKIVDNTIKILSHYLNKSSDIILVSKLEPVKLVKNISQIFLYDYLNIDNETERVVNNMSLMISLVGRNPNLSENMREILKNIIEIAKEKTDLLRKNAAILLAKIAKSSEKMEGLVRELHGMDVLLNVTKFIQLNK